MSSAVSIPKRAVIVQAHTLVFEPDVRWEPYLQLRLCQTTLLRSLALFVSAKWRQRYRKKGWSLLKILDKNDDEFEHPAETVWGALELTPICAMLGFSFGNTVSKDMRIILSFKLDSGQEQLSPDLGTFSQVNQAKYGFRGMWRFSVSDQLDGRYEKDDDVVGPVTPAAVTVNSATDMSLCRTGQANQGRRILPLKVTFDVDASKIRSMTEDKPEYTLSSGDTESSPPYNPQSSSPVTIGTPVKAAFSKDGLSRSKLPLRGILKCSPSTEGKLHDTSSPPLRPTSRFRPDTHPSTPRGNHHSTFKRPRSDLTPIPFRGQKRLRVEKPSTHQSGSPEGADRVTEEQRDDSLVETESQNEIERNLELASRLAEMQRVSSEADRARNPVPLTPRKAHRGKRPVAQRT